MCGSTKIKEKRPNQQNVSTSTKTRQRMETQTRLGLYLTMQYTGKIVMENISGRSSVEMLKNQTIV